MTFYCGLVVVRLCLSIVVISIIIGVRITISIVMVVVLWVLGHIFVM